MKKITQKQIAFYLLYRNYRESKEEYLPTWYFLGEHHVKPLNRWVLASYKCPARLSDIMRENPGLLERKNIEGKSGSHYYTYRISLEVNPKMIQDESLKEFYQDLRRGEIVLEMKKGSHGVINK